MAGSFAHIVDDNGQFTIDTIENLGDAHEALEECYMLIWHLADGDTEAIKEACSRLLFPEPPDLKPHGDIE